MEQKDFFITTIGGLRDVSDLLMTEDTLNNNIKLADFGENVKNISFYALTYCEPNTFNEPFWQYQADNKKIEGSLPLDYEKASAYEGEEAQKLMCSAIFELLDKISSQVDNFDFAALKKAMLEAVEINPSSTDKIKLRIHSDGEPITSKDISEFENSIHFSKYGEGVRKLTCEISFVKNSQSYLSNPPQFDAARCELYISVVSSPDMEQFSAELDKVMEKLRFQVPDFNFELFKADILLLIVPLLKTSFEL